MPRTSRAMSAPDASRRMSWITAVPPTLSTRCISSSARRGWLKFLKAAWQTTRSNDPSANGIAATSPCRKSTVTPARRAFSLAISTNVRLMSMAVTPRGPGRASSIAK